MSLSSSRLAGKLATVIEAKVRSAILENDPTPYPNLTKFAQALGESIAQEVVDEIVQNGVVTGFVTGTVIGTTNPTANTCQVVLADGNNVLEGGIS